MALKDYQEAIFKKLKFEPTAAQRPFFDAENRIRLVTGGERSGKSTVGEMDTTLHHTFSQLIWIVAATYDIPRYVEFDHIADNLDKLGFLKEKHRPEQGVCTMYAHNGCRILTKSATDPEKLAMEAPDYILMVEAAQVTYETYLRILGRASEKNAPITLTGTFELAGASKWYEELYTRWQAPNELNAKSFSMPTWSNLVKYPPGNKTIILPGNRVLENVNDRIYELWCETPPDMFLLRYAAEPCKPAGLIMSEFSVINHVGNYEFNPDLPVYLAVDPGYAGAHVVEVAQYVEDNVYLIDEIYLQGYITEQIIDICKTKKWWGKVSGGAIDIAGTQHQATRAPVDIWSKQGKVSLVSRKVNEEQGIERLRSFLKINPLTNKPKIFVDYKCKGFISECGGGKSPVPGGGPWIRDVNTMKPLDKNDHACKAVIYLLVNKFGYTTGEGEDLYGKLLSFNQGRFNILRR